MRQSGRAGTENFFSGSSGLRVVRDLLISFFCPPFFCQLPKCDEVGTPAREPRRAEFFRREAKNRGQKNETRLRQVPAFLISSFNPTAFVARPFVARAIHIGRRERSPYETKNRPGFREETRP
ncbi:MAG: hypothetical protein NTY53_01110, partial [Kiritimatiellaeota bacterium]|nr:hypothetical protein [Kiritimatiellota bacterium]